MYRESRNKYGAVTTYYNPESGKESRERLTQKDWKFDSLFEFRIFNQIKEIFPLSRIHRQVKLQVKPSTDVYPERVWRCDFLVCHEKLAESLYIEAKGVPTREFLGQMEYLELHNPTAYQRLVIVASVRQELPRNKLRFVNEIDLAQILKSFKESGNPSSTTGKRS